MMFITLPIENLHYPSCQLAPKLSAQNVPVGAQFIAR
jgi:hypothetical protein